MKRILPVFLLGCALLACKQSKAQDPEFTQFYANPLYLNPAFAGTHNCPRISLGYRNQWPALSGTFTTQLASYDQHIDAINGGLGIMIVSDNAGKGILTNNRISGMYSYQLKLNRTFSVRVGVELKFGDMIDERRGFIYQTGDIPRGGSNSGIDLSAGILGFSKNFFIGFSAHHLNEPDESVINSGNSPIPMKLTGHAGAIIPLGDTKYADNVASISPNIMYRQQAGFTQVNMGVYLKKGAITGGVWYRNKDAFIATVGFQTNQFQFGYSYDITISRLGTGSAGSHEISMQLKFDCKPKKRIFRAITCPSF